MSGFDNEVVVTLGERLESSSAQAVSLMQKTASDVSRVNYSGNPEGNISANPSSLCHDPTSGNVFYKATGTGNTGWALLGSVALSVLINKYETPGTHTWTKSASTKMVQVIAWGGGSGGGSGGRYAVGQSIGGGAGACGNGGIFFECFAENLGATETVTVGAGGAGGAAVTTDDTEGNDGAPGGVSGFGNIFTLDETIFNYTGSSSYGKAGGLGVNNGGGLQGPIIYNGAILTSYLYAGQAGLANAESALSVPDSTALGYGQSKAIASYLCNIGGGGGAGIDNVDFGTAGDGGGFVSGNDASILSAGGAAGVTGVNNGDGEDGIDGGDATNGGILLGGTGGGGGAPNPAGRGGNGGNGGQYGGGGGGGAASNNGFNSGAGGNGGDGAVWVIEYLSQSPSTVDVWPAGVLGWTVGPSNEDPIQMEINQGYISGAVSPFQQQYLLPETPAIGNVVRIAGLNSGGWRITPRSNEVILYNNTPAIGGLGQYIESSSTSERSAIELLCVVSGFGSYSWLAISGMNNVTIGP